MNNDNVPFVPQQPIPEQPPKQGGMSDLTYIIVNVIISFVTGPVLFFGVVFLPVSVMWSLEKGGLSNVIFASFFFFFLPIILLSALHVFVYRIYRQKLTVDGKLTKKTRRNIVVWIIGFIVDIVGILICIFL